jgi:hypothetical protein
MPLRQRPDWQSEAMLHLLPLAQAVHPPPQSTSLSEPFLMPSVHVGA